MSGNHIALLLSLHKKLAGRLKEYELTTNLPPPHEVLNETRYALRAVMFMVELVMEHGGEEAVLASDDRVVYMDHVQQAKLALRQGYHDLLDGLGSDLFSYVADHVNGLSPAALAALGDYPDEVLADLEAMKEDIIGSRVQLRERDGAYDNLYDRHFELLCQHRKELTSAMVRLASERALQEQEERQAEQLAIIERRLRKSTVGGDPNAGGSSALRS